MGRVWDCTLCTSVSEEGGDGESAGSEALSLLSYTPRYISSRGLSALRLAVFIKKRKKMEESLLIFKFQAWSLSVGHRPNRRDLGQK